MSCLLLHGPVLKDQRSIPLITRGQDPDASSASETSPLSRTIRERIWYYAEKISGIVISSLVYSAITSLIFVIICLLTGRCAMNGYTQAYFEECLSANKNTAQAADNRSTPVFLGDMKPLTKADIARKKYRYSPVNKTVTVLWALCGLAMLILLAAGFLSKNAALAFYVTGSWQRGINPFAITAIAVIVCIGRLLLIGLDRFFSMINSEMPDKGKTIVQLVRSLMRFAVIIGLFYNCLTYLGVDTRALVASVGIFSLALSLGAKDLVADILAGLGIVIEEQFQTEEIVEIDGYKGFVDKIGVRSTKIRSFGTNNIETINNSEIHNVINYSRELSMFFVKIDLPVFLPLDMVTEYLERELPLIREEIPTIISGPKFTGISAIDRNQMAISISGQCLEKDVFFINKAINMRIKERIDRLVDFKNN